MLFVGVATVASMLSELRGYFAEFGERWLLAIMGSLILALDLWVVFEGLRILVSDGRRASQLSDAAP
jgi:hypothetical protein